MSDEITRRPIPEARPPHLPDVLTRQSPWVVLFGVVAVINAWVSYRSWAGDFPIPDSAAWRLLFVNLTPAVISPLLGVVLFIRHPTAHRTMPLLVFGLILLAVGELLSTFDQPIRQFLAAFSPSFPSVGEFPAPADTAYTLFKSLLSLFALLYLGAGLTSARQRDRASAERPLTAWLVALAIISGVVSIAVIAQMRVEFTAALLIQVVLSLGMSLLLTLGWAYVTAVAVGGWLAGDVPRRAWRVGAGALSTLFIVRLGFSVFTVLTLPDPFFVIIEIATVVVSVAWLLLLAAFWLGLPSASAATADRPAATQPGSAAG